MLRKAQDTSLVSLPACRKSPRIYFTLHSRVRPQSASDLTVPDRTTHFHFRFSCATRHPGAIGFKASQASQSKANQPAQFPSSRCTLHSALCTLGTHKTPVQRASIRSALACYCQAQAQAQARGLIPYRTVWRSVNEQVRERGSPNIEREFNSRPLPTTTSGLCRPCLP